MMQSWSLLGLKFNIDLSLLQRSVLRKQREMTQEHEYVFLNSHPELQERKL